MKPKQKTETSRSKSKQCDRTRKRKPHYEMFRDSLGDYRWRLRAGNGRITATGAEGYDRRDRVVTAIQLHREQASIAEVKDFTPEGNNDAKWI